MTSRKSSNPKIPKKSDTMRERLIEAATEVFAERGYDGAAVSRIARRAGVTTGAIYGLFAGKAELLLEVIRRRLQMQIEPYRNLYEDGVLPDSNELFLSMTRDRLESGQPLTRALLLETFAAARRDPDVRAIVREWLDETSGAVAAFIRRAQEAGAIDKELHAPTLAWFYMISGAGEAFTEAAGMNLPRANNYLPMVDRVFGSFRAPTHD